MHPVLAESDDDESHQRRRHENSVRADDDEESLQLHRHENSVRAYTWRFSARVHSNLVDSSSNTTFKALLDSRIESQKKYLGAADTITFSCSDLSETEVMTFSVEGFVHGSDKIGKCSLNQWLPLNHIPELKAIEF